MVKLYYMYRTQTELMLHEARPSPHTQSLLVWEEQIVWDELCKQHSTARNVHNNHIILTYHAWKCIISLTVTMAMLIYHLGMPQ